MLRRIIRTTWILIPLMVLSGAQHASADVLQAPAFARQESAVQSIQYLKSGEILYNFRWDLELSENGGQRFVNYKGYGDNTLKGENRVDWTEEARYLLSKTGLQTIFWKKDSSGAEKESWKLSYDWKKRRVNYEYIDHLSGKHDEKLLTIGQGAMPSDAMYFLLRAFPFERGAGAKIEGEFILTDGTILKGAIIHRGEQKLKTAFGVIDTYKLEMDPSGFIGAFAPSMYLWYTKTEPHIFLRFDGKDNGLLKPRTRNVLLDYKPEKWITASRQNKAEKTP